jgi:hypothetical protein
MESVSLISDPEGIAEISRWRAPEPWRQNDSAPEGRWKGRATIDAAAMQELPAILKRKVKPQMDADLRR